MWSHLAALAGRRWRHAEASQRYREALRIHEETGNLHHASVARLGLAMREIDAGQAVGAETSLRAVRDHERRSGNRRLQAFAEAGLAAAAHDRGDLRAARRHLAETAALFAGRDRVHEAAGLATSAVVDHEAGDLDGARAGLVEALVSLADVGDRSLLAFAEAQLGAVMSDQADVDGALAAFDRARKHAERASMESQLALQDLLRGFLDLARARNAKDPTARAHHRDAAKARLEARSAVEGSHHRIARRRLRARLSMA